MKRTLLCLVAAFAAHTLLAANTGDEVIVVYNSRMPESKAVAEYYAQKRHVPARQIFGFDLPTTEDISRPVFRDSLLKPLAKAIEKEKLWHIGSSIVDPTNGQSARVEWKPMDCKIRYAVLCYGVPLRIPEDPSLVEAGIDQMRPELRRNCASVDAELALLPLIEHTYTITGPMLNPLYTTTNASVLNPGSGLLMVARLDGPSPEIARGLVDKALEAERDGLWGRAYFDVRSVTEPAAKLGDDWLRAAAEISRFVGMEVTVDTNASTLATSFPMSHIAFYAGWYDGVVTGPFTLPYVEFMPGAFAYHLYSFSAASLRNPNLNWAGTLLAKGAACTMGSVYEPYLQGTPDIGTFFGRFLPYGFTFGEAAYASQNSLSWQTTVIGDPLYRPMYKSPQVMHQELQARNSPLLEWSHLKVVDLNLFKHVPLTAVATYLEDTPLTRQSSVLSEKLAEVYTQMGKKSSVLRTYEQALGLKTSPQQRIRLRLLYSERLAEQGFLPAAIENYRNLIAEAPDYPGKSLVLSRIAAYEAQLSPTNAAPTAPAAP